MYNDKIKVVYKGVRGFDESFYSLSVYSLPKQELKFLHYHGYMELGVCLEGSGVCYTDKGEMKYEAGDVQLILPFQPHYNITDNDNTRWMFISVDLCRLSSKHVKLEPAYFLEMAQRIDVSGVFKKAEAPDIHYRISDISSLFQSKIADDDMFSDLLTVRLAELIAYLSCDKAKAIDDYKVYKKNSSIIPAMNYVSYAIDAMNRPKVSEMADACFMSESYFRKVFASVMGESPKSYVIRMQIQRAADLLSTTELTTAEISEKCGFSDNSTFYRCFMKIYGLSPNEYRKKCRQD